MEPFFYDVFSLGDELIAPLNILDIENTEVVVVLCKLILHASQYFHEEIVGKHRHHSCYHFQVFPRQPLGKGFGVVPHILGNAQYLITGFW